MKKEKVIAIRVTQEQYDILEWARVNIFNDDNAKTMSRFVVHVLKADLNEFSRARHDILKREEAAAKRRAKKAANDTK